MNYTYTQVMIIFDNILFFKLTTSLNVECFLNVFYTFWKDMKIFEFYYVLFHTELVKYMPQTYRLKCILPSFKKTIILDMVFSSSSIWIEFVQ